MNSYNNLCSCYGDIISEQTKTINQFKELLKECRYKIIADLDNARMRESSVDIEDFEYLLNRMTLYLKGECNAFRAKRPVSKPIIFWTDEDIWEYINSYKISYSPIYDKGFERTGCMFCMYGCHNKGDKRFELMKQNYPKIYDYCMNKLKMKEVLDVVINKGEKH